MAAPKTPEGQILAAIADLAQRQSKLEIAMNEMIVAFMERESSDPFESVASEIRTDDPELSAALTRMQQQISVIHEFTLMQLAVTQVMAIKLGLSQDDYDARAPRPVPTPFDLMAMLKPRD